MSEQISAQEPFSISPAGEQMLLRIATTEAVAMFAAIAVQPRFAVVRALAVKVMEAMEQDFVVNPAHYAGDLTGAEGCAMMVARMALKDLCDQKKLHLMHVTDLGVDAVYLVKAGVSLSKPGASSQQAAVDVAVKPAMLSNQVLMDYLKAGAELHQDGSDLYAQRSYSLVYSNVWCLPVPVKLGDALNTLNLVEVYARSDSPDRAVPRYVLRWA